MPSAETCANSIDDNCNFDNSGTLPGGCNETYRLTGSFVGANTFVGTYSVSFSGSDCGCFGGLGTPCVNQTWNISAGR